MTRKPLTPAQRRAAQQKQTYELMLADQRARALAHRTPSDPPSAHENQGDSERME